MKRVRPRPTPGFGGLHIGADVSPEALELGVAVQRWERRHGRRADSRTVLAVAKALGYRRLARPE